VTVFFAILSADDASLDEMNASTKQLLCCRCLYSLVDILPNTSRYVFSSGGLPILCSKLISIQYIDVAEQCISIFQRLAEYGPIQVLKAGSLQPVLMFLDFFALPSQRAAVTAAASMVSYIPSSEVFDQHVKPAVPQLLQLLQHQDARVRETAGGALRSVTDSLVHIHRRKKWRGARTVCTVGEARGCDGRTRRPQREDRRGIRMFVSVDGVHRGHLGQSGSSLVRDR
jgi:hypothetical protein